MFSTLLITFREGLEALLVVAIASLYLRKTGHVGLISAVRAGLALAVLLSVGLGMLLAQAGESSPAWEGSLALVAGVAVLACVLHMRKMGKHMGAEISSGLSKATMLDGAHAWWGVFTFVVFMVGREGVETAAMLASLASKGGMMVLFAGGLGGLAVAAFVAMLWTRYGKRVNLARFFKVTSVFMLAFAVLLLLKGVFEFSEAELLPLVDNAYWHDLLEPVIDGDFAQVLSLLLVLAPTAWLLAAHVHDRRKLSASASH
jgi:high-affinity iron transporter